jgi:pyrimidine oxygenase
MAEAAAKTGRDVGNYVLLMVIADETDEAAMAKWKHYNEGADLDAMTWLADQANADASAAATSTARQMAAPTGAVNFNMGTLVGSYANVARMLDEFATVPATKGLMLTFDDFLIGMEQFGQRIQPLMQSRRAKLAAVA